jgi:Polysaccharide lyase
MSSGSSRWVGHCAGAVALLVWGTVGAHEMAVHWANDPATERWASTYQAVYDAQWQSTMDPRIVVQANPGDVAGVADPANSASRVLRASISRNEDFSAVANGAPRAEIMFPTPVRFAQGEDYLIRWSTYLPPSFGFDSKQLMIITQIHQTSETGSPTIALTLLGTQYFFSERGGSNPTQVSGSMSLCCADADRGRWVHWTLRYIPDDSGQHALTDLYKDGTSVFAAQGVANAYLGDQAAYLKIGLYKPNWISQPSDVDQSTVFYGPVYVAQR